MTPVLVDADVLLDIATDDAVWGARSLQALWWAGQGARLVITPPVYAALSLAHARIETLDALLPEDVFHREPMPWAAAFLAGRACLAQHRAAGIDRLSWPDVQIGAHAAIRGYRLLTRDGRRYRAAFPRLVVLTPEA